MANRGPSTTVVDADELTRRLLLVSRNRERAEVFYPLVVESLAGRYIDGVALSPHFTGRYSTAMRRLQRATNCSCRALTTISEPS